MAANLIDGKALANKVKESLKNDIKRLSNERGIVPGLTVILVGNDPASQIYVRNKERACMEVGIRSNVVYMEESIQQDDLLREIHKYNRAFSNIVSYAKFNRASPESMAIPSPNFLWLVGIPLL
jgi:methylenetetrahydrofolate dehydrogenase (NADP+)/methenyltetrahydrofolate cyclohydrolase